MKTLYLCYLFTMGSHTVGPAFSDRDLSVSQAEVRQKNGKMAMRLKILWGHISKAPENVNVSGSAGFHENVATECAILLNLFRDKNCVKHMFFLLLSMA